MKPTSISYSESKESFDITTGLKSWRKAGVEIELDGEDNIIAAYDEAKNIISSALGINQYDRSSFVTNGVPLPKDFITALPTIDYSKERAEIAIENASSLRELEFNESEAIKHGLVPQYLEKKKSLK